MATSLARQAGRGLNQDCNFRLIALDDGTYIVESVCYVVNVYCSS